MGGENAELDAADSVTAMLARIDALTFDVEAVGAFRSHKGEAVPW
jgi:hypothetical protein